MVKIKNKNEIDIIFTLSKLEFQKMNETDMTHYAKNRNYITQMKIK